jgi:very-short-patch-repair endonuclease
MAIVNLLKEKLPDINFIHNKSIGSDCTDGHLFPDIRFDCDFYNLIVEVDEHKHRGANYKCDKQRMYDIIAKLGLPCIFIRYNPDNKHSDQNVLLNTITNYLDLKVDNRVVWNKFGFKVEYMFY